MSNRAAFKRKSAAICCVLSLIFSVSKASAQSDPIFDAKGFQPNRDYFSEFPFEHIDTATGGLTLTFTDLVLPGNAGHALRFTRSSSSKGGGLSAFGIEGIPLFVVDDWWDFHPPGSTDPGVTLVLVGGDQLAKIPLQMTGNSAKVVMTDRFWKYDRDERTLRTPNGSVGTYDQSRRLTQWADAFGNQLGIAWVGSRVTITQFLGTQSRQIVVEWPDPLLTPTSMIYEGRTWTYSAASVTPPVGPGWRFEWPEENVYAITTPHGSRVEYVFQWKQLLKIPPDQYVSTKVLTERRTFDRGASVPTGTWKYQYDLNVTLFSNETEIESPSGVITTYRHVLLRQDPFYCGEPYAARCYLVSERIVLPHRGASEELEHESRGYKFVAIPCLSLPGYPPCAFPELETQTISRGGQTYSTTLRYRDTSYGDFHMPYQIEETGQLSRTTYREFRHSTNAPYDAPYIVGLPTVERITSNSQTFETLLDPDPANGFVRSETRYGITTTFTPTQDQRGNIWKATNANNKTTSFTYDWGRVKNTSTPEYLIERTINPDGTVASEKNGGRETTYTYDDLSRITMIHPPAGGDAASNPIFTDYDNEGGAWVRTKRGEGTPSYSQVITTLDGFGRPIATEDNANAHTRTAYDAEGRVSYQGMPYTPNVDDGDVGTVIEYDGLGRVLKETHSDGKFRQYAYSGNTLTVTDENGAGHSTVITRQSFGDPDEVRVASVRDANQNLWSYQYNAVGSLERVTAPGNSVRQWTYDSRNLLQSETHPESGTVTYNDYWPNGMLKKKTDAKGTIFNYEYDGNDRLKKITAGNDVIQITYEPGSDNRATMTAPDVLTTFIWDAAGRLKKRTDTIGGAVFDAWFTYDGNGNLETQTYPSGRRIQYVYTLENRLREIRNDNANQVYASTFEYHPSGAVKKYQSGNNLVTEIGYDKKRYWVNDIKIGSLRHFAYSAYDNVGNVKQINDDRAGKNQSFTYDLVDRLATANGPYGSMTLNYDAHGNRQASNYQYDPNNPFRLLSIDNLSMVYDNNGNLYQAPGVQFDYVRGSIMERSVVNGTETHYRYDGDDWRVKKAVTNGATTYFVRGPNGQLLTEWRNASPNPEVRDFIYAGSRLIAVIKTTTLQPK